MATFCSLSLRFCPRFRELEILNARFKFFARRYFHRLARDKDIDASRVNGAR